jgi:hypothetical protein
MSKFHHYERCPECASSGRDTRGDNLAVYYNGSKHCFSCGYHRHPVGFVIPNNDLEIKHASSALPRDFSREVPTDAWKWLLQYGLPYTYWKPHCGYSETEGRLVFTVGNPIEFSIGRLVKDPDPNGNHAKKRKWYVWGNSHQHCEIINPKEDSGKTPILLVEDIVSAHKTGQITPTIPLFGTEIHPCHLYHLMSAQRPISLWLDKDQEHTVRKKAMRLQVLTGNPVNVIITENDPKSYSINKIKEILE